jgi:hypothetical protein
LGGRARPQAAAIAPRDRTLNQLEDALRHARGPPAMAVAIARDIADRVPRFEEIAAERLASAKPQPAKRGEREERSLRRLSPRVSTCTGCHAGRSRNADGSLARTRDRITKTARRTAETVNLGKIVEKIVPSYDPGDCSGWAIDTPPSGSIRCNSHVLINNTICSILFETDLHGTVPPMTSSRQIEANRLNALKSTGPVSANGKHVARRNALRHGFTAQTVLEPLENPEEYRTFGAAILSEYLPQTPVEQELVHRLALLFWRLRRATSIETGLFRMQGEILRAFRSSRQKTLERRGEETADSLGETDPGPRQGILADGGADEFASESGQGASGPSRDVALSYLRLVNLDNELIDRLSRYEGGLWRQAVQTLFALQALKRR